MPGRDADVGRRGRREAWLVSGLSETESNEINGQKAHNPGACLDRINMQWIYQVSASYIIKEISIVMVHENLT